MTKIDGFGISSHPLSTGGRAGGAKGQMAARNEMSLETRNVECKVANVE
jgi:hypothetical protein